MNFSDKIDDFNILIVKLFICSSIPELRNIRLVNDHRVCNQNNTMVSLVERELHILS